LKLAANSRAVATQDQPTTTMRAALLDWSPGVCATRRGFAKVKIGGVSVPDIPVCTSHGKAWASPDGGVHPVPLDRRDMQ
jgi:hypothetical protein